MRYFLRAVRLGIKPGAGARHELLAVFPAGPAQSLGGCGQFVPGREVVVMKYGLSMRKPE